jgi:ATP:ADP antiporter, AAA family
MLLTPVKNLLRLLFGEFEPDELKKFLLLGIIFGLIIGIYWTLRPMKDSLFQDIVGATYQPRAKWLSLVVVFPLVIIYSKLVEMLPRHILFYVLSLAYGIMALIITWFMFDPQIGLPNLNADPSRVLGWVWYVFVESFGSLIIALFWAFATDITSAESAKKGFSLVVMLGQIGGMIGPFFLTKIPMSYNISNAYVILICAVLIFLIIPLVKLFLASVPKGQMVGFSEKGHTAEVEPGFFEGLRLLFSQPYLIGILGVISFYEVIVTVFDYYFKTMADAQIPDKAIKMAYLGDYATYANAATFLCLLFGISNIQRHLGLTTALTLMPFIVGFAVIVFKFYTAMQPLFWLMVGSKAINYALNSPSMKQLYIPTSKDVRYKSQAWIEVYGSRGAKAAGSGITDLHKNALASNGPEWANKEFAKTHMFGPLDKGTFFHIAVSSYVFFGILAVWVVIALYLGRTYQKHVDENKIVC